MANKWNSSVEWQNDSNYVLRCVEESFGPSRSSGKPMITLKFEVASPDTMEVAGEPFTIASTQIMGYYVTQSVDENGVVDEAKSAECLKRLTALYKAFGLPTDNIDINNPALGFKGKLVYALLTNDRKERRKSLTKAQLDKGVKQGDIMINPITKKILMNNYPKLQEIYGLAPTDTNKPY
jgi:hypothetical protein